MILVLLFRFLADTKPLTQRNLPPSFFCPPAAQTSPGSYPPSPSSTSSYPQAGPSQASPQVRASPSHLNGPSPSHLAGHPSPSYLSLPSTSTSLPLTDFYSASTPSTSDYDPWSHYVQGYRTAQLSGHDLKTYAAAANRHQFAQHQVGFSCPRVADATRHPDFLFGRPRHATLQHVTSRETMSPVALHAFHAKIPPYDSSSSE